MEKLEGKVKGVSSDATPEERSVLEYCGEKIAKMYERRKKTNLKPAIIDYNQ